MLQRCAIERYVYLAIFLGLVDRTCRPVSAVQVYCIFLVCVTEIDERSALESR